MQTDRPGVISLAVLLAGIFFVLLVLAGSIMANQVKASENTNRQLTEANVRLAEANLPTLDTPTVKGAKIDTTKTKTYTKEGLSFQYPANLTAKEGGEDNDPSVLELATDKKYFGNVLVPKNQLKVTVKRNVAYRLETLDDYLKLAPYATKHRKTQVNGRPVLIITNKYNTTTWVQAVFEHSPQGPYTLMTFQPGDSYRFNDAYDVIVPTVKIEE